MEKIDTDLRMALDTPLSIREKSLDLNVGYEEMMNEWEVILRYSGDIISICMELGLEIEELLGGYAITYVTEQQIKQLQNYPQIDYIEKPKQLHLQDMQTLASSCVVSVQEPPFNLTGKGVLLACIDSGADIFHPDFRDVNGDTRIVAFWDQQAELNDPNGVIYEAEQINSLLREGERRTAFDTSGHGTAVLGIAASNGAASSRQRKGVAPDTNLIVVKMSAPDEKGFARTTQLMRGVDFCVRKAMELRMPLAINVSFGNNYGDHYGDTMLERYMDAVSDLYPVNIVVGSGNEGLSARHASVKLLESEQEGREIEIVVSPYLQAFNLQIWKTFSDDVDIYIKTPNGKTIGPFSKYSATQFYEVGNDLIAVYYGEPTPYNIRQEIYISFTSLTDYVTSGIWFVQIRPRRIIDGTVDLWLPVKASTTSDVSFIRPSLDNTITIPATARRVISVSAYNSYINTFGAFSGRGRLQLEAVNTIKPDLCAPGVDVVTCAVGGGYTTVTGTSFATPFVTGAVALLMQYGIVDGNDEKLYGERIKAYLRNGAIPLPYQMRVPDNMSGYGKLCVSNSITRQ